MSIARRLSDGIMTKIDVYKAAWLTASLHIEDFVVLPIGTPKEDIFPKIRIHMQCRRRCESILMQGRQ